MSSPSITRPASSACRCFFFAPTRTGATTPSVPAPMPALEDAEVLEAFISQFYEGRTAAKAHPGLSRPRRTRTARRGALLPRRRQECAIQHPSRGEKRDLVQHALDNAREALGRQLVGMAPLRKSCSKGSPKPSDFRRAAASHRNLRQLPHPGHQCRRRHGRGRRGRIFEKALPHLQHQIRKPHAWRRFRHDARSADPPFHPPCQ